MTKNISKMVMAQKKLTKNVSLYSRGAKIYAKNISEIVPVAKIRD